MDTQVIDNKAEPENGKSKDSISFALSQEKSIHEVSIKYPQFRKKINEGLKSWNLNKFSSLLKEYDLKSLNPGAGDPIATFLYSLDGYKVFIASLIAILIGGLPAIVAIIEGNFNNPILNSQGFDTIHDIGYWNQYIIALPAVVMLGGRYFSNLPKTLFELVLHGIFKLNKFEWNSFVIEAENKYKNKFFVFFPYLAGITASIFLYSIYTFNPEYQSWYSLRFNNSSTYAGFFMALDIAILWYLIPLYITRIVSTFFVLKIYFKKTANIQPLHPDGRGGLAPLGNLSMTLNLGAFIFGLFTVIGIYSNTLTYNMDPFHFINIIMVLLYVSIASVLFFVPLLAAHNSMKKAKYEIVQTINENFDSINSELVEDLHKRKRVDSARLKELEALNKMYLIGSKMPIYPFNVRMVSAFIGSIFTPLLLVFLEEVIKSFLESIGW